MHIFKIYKVFLIGFFIAFIIPTVFFIISSYSLNLEASSISTFLKMLGGTLFESIFEELIFRLLLFNFIKKYSSKPTALLLSSLVFALMHLGNEHFTIISFLSHFAGGIVYGYGYIIAKNIILPIGLHFGWNFTQRLFYLPMSGTVSNSGIVRAILPSNDLWFGGNYGIEGGIYSLFLRGLIFLLLLAFFRYKNNS